MFRPDALRSALPRRAKDLAMSLPTAPLHAVARDVLVHRWWLGFKQSILDPIARVLRGVRSGMFARTPASPPCSCPLRLSPSGKTVDPEAPLPASPVCDRDSTRRFHGALPSESHIEVGTPAFRWVTLALTAAGFSTFTVLYCVQPLMPVFADEFHVSPAESSL